MSRLEELIEQLCPDGVEYKTLGSTVGVNRGKRLTKKELSDNNQYAVYHGSKDTPLGYYDKSNVSGNTTIVVNTGGIGGVKYCEYDFWCSDGSFWLGKTEELLDKYVYYWTSQFEEWFYSQKRIGGVPTIDRETVESLEIPVPPLEIQREIVRILDSFTELTAELTVEKSFRDKQYRYYSTLLFDKAKKTKDTYKIGDICSIEKGKTPIQKSVPGKYPLVVTTSERKTCCDFQFDSPSVCIPLVSSRGHGVASLNHVYYQEGKFALGNILCAITPISNQLILPKYLYYYFEQTKDYTLVPLMKGGANVSLHLDDIARIKVPVPSIDEQSFIVDLLQRFELYTNESLSLEITTRQKQYEYYRDKLLTFKRKGD